MAEPPKTPTPLSIERWLLDELTEPERAELEAALSAETRSSLREADQRLRARLFQKLPAAAFAQKLRARREKTVRAAYVAMPLLAAAAAALMVVLQRPDAPRAAADNAAPSLPSERVKGLAPQLHVYRKGSAAVEELRDDATAQPRDLLQLGYVSAGRRYGVLISIDGNGSVTTHLPRLGDRAAPLSNHGEQLLPSAYELDAAPRYERFFFVTGGDPFPTSKVLEAARMLAHDPARAATSALPLDRGLEQQTLRLRKETP